MNQTWRAVEGGGIALDIGGHLVEVFLNTRYSDRKIRKPLDQGLGECRKSSCVVEWSRRAIDRFGRRRRGMQLQQEVPKRLEHRGTAVTAVQFLAFDFVADHNGPLGLAF